MVLWPIPMRNINKNMAQMPLSHTVRTHINMHASHVIIPRACQQQVNSIKVKELRIKRSLTLDTPVYLSTAKQNISGRCSQPELLLSHKQCPTGSIGPVALLLLAVSSRLNNYFQKEIPPDSSFTNTP